MHRLPDVYSVKPSESTEDYKRKILSLRQRGDVRNNWLKYRLENLLPKLMKEQGLEMWLVIAREYNEDPVILSLLPEPQMSARRRTILVYMMKQDGTLERLILSRTGLGEFYKTAWNPDQDEQYDCLAKIIAERDPQSIGINYGETFAFGDGLTHSEYIQLCRAVDGKYIKRMKSAETLCVRWLETRTPNELVIYPSIVEITHTVVSEAFSTRVIHAGITTVDDLSWWVRQKFHDLGVQPWFPPSISKQSAEPNKTNMIMPGDMLHCDVGFNYLGLCTDVQRLAYVLKPGEVDAPEGLKAGLKDGNRLQDIHAEEMVAGRDGNEILKNTLDRSKAEGIIPSVYTHPIGVHGHAAGPIIGLWDRQGGVPGRGDYKLYDDTCYSIELNVKKAVPEWNGMMVTFALEEDAAFTQGKLQWISGRQTKFYLV